MTRRKKTYRKKSTAERLHEDAVPYYSVKLADLFKTITISTLKEQEEQMRAYSASLSSVERMAYLHSLNGIAFGRTQKKNRAEKNKIIYIDLANGIPL